MAMQLDTNNEGAGEDENLDVWLQNNNLQKARQKLVENNASLVDLKDLAEDESIHELKLYAQNELKLDLLTAKRFAKAVSALSTSNKPSISQTSGKIVRILITKEEQDATNNIIKRREEIKSKINSSLNNINILKQTSTTNTDQLNQFRKEIMYQMNQRIDKLIADYDKIIDGKKEIFNDNIKTLQNMDQLLHSADSQCNKLLEDTTIDINKRKIKIVNISNDALKSPIKDIGNAPKIAVDLDKNAVIDFINNMGIIIDSDVPSEPNLSVADIEESTATVMMNNMKSSWECSLKICTGYNGDNDNDDDEKKDDMEWKDLCSIKNANKYKITTLSTDTSYGLRGRYKGNGDYYGIWCKPISFKTKPPQKDRFKINNMYSTTFTNKNGYAFHTFGTKQIERKYIEKYEWKVTFNKQFSGRIGIIHNTDDSLNKVKNGTNLEKHDGLIAVGTHDGNWPGSVFGSYDQEMRQFIQTNCDTITINLNYVDNTVSFKSNKANKTISRKLKNGIDSVKFIAEFGRRDNTITLL